MRIILKYLFKNIKEKKLRTILIIFSIAISCALFFASSSVTDTFAKMFSERVKIYFGNADLMITSNSESISGIMNTAKADRYDEYFEYVAGIFDTSAQHKINDRETLNFYIHGMEYDDAKAMSDFSIVKGNAEQGYYGMSIILSDEFAEKYGYSIGDSINVNIYGSVRKLKIIATAAGGLFTDDGFNNFAIVPHTTISGFYDVKGMSNVIYLKLKNIENLNQVTNLLKNEYKGYTVKEPFDTKELKQQISSISTPFMLMTFIVVFMSVFIIYTSFKVISMERLPAIGTFRSIGATKKTTDIVLLGESIFYGTLGGAVGIGFGLLVLKFMAEMMKSPWEKNMEAVVEYQPIQMIISFLFAVILCVISSLIPILQISKISIKDIVLNTIDRPKRRGSIRVYLGLMFVAMGMIFPVVSPKSMAFAINIISITITFAGVIMLIPAVTSSFVALFERIYVFIFGNIGIVAAKNLRENKSILNNISLLVIGISSLFLINTISYSVGVEVTGFYSKAKFDIWANFWGADRNLETRLNAIDGVNDVYSIYEASNIKVKGENDNISTLHGIDYRKYFKYWDFHVHEDTVPNLYLLDEDRNILLSSVLKDKYELGYGDYITLEINKKYKKYKVVGFFDSLFNNGSIALISDKYYKLDTGVKYYSSVFIKSDDSGTEKLIKLLKKNFARNYPYVTTLEELEDMNNKSNEQMFILLKGFSVLAMLIGIIGVVNNLLVAFIQRKRYIAVMRSVGMDKGQTIKMLLIEAMTGGLIGGIFGVITGFLMLNIVARLMVAIGLPIAMHYSTTEIITSAVSGAFIMVVSAVSPAIKSSRLNIINAIKYE